MDVLIIGGTLFIGRRLADALIEGGHSVTILHRNPTSKLPDAARSLIADRNEAEAVRLAVGGRRFDAVFDNVYDWQRGTDAAAVEAAARACAHRGLGCYVFMSSVAAYRPGLDLDETAPLAADDDANRYAANKAASERALFRLWRDEGFPAVTLRPAFIYGPGNPFYREAFFWDRLRAGRRILVPGDGLRLMQFVHVDDLVRLCLRILDAPRVRGEAFNACGAPLTQIEMAQALARASGMDARLVHVPRVALSAAGASLTRPNLYFGEVLDLPPITMDTAKARATLGFEPVPFEEGLRETYEWWVEAKPFPHPDYSFEDALLAGRA